MFTKSIRYVLAITGSIALGYVSAQAQVDTSRPPKPYAKANTKNLLPVLSQRVAAGGSLSAPVLPDAYLDAIDISDNGDRS